MMGKIPSWAHQLKQPCKGASEIILEQCNTFLDGEGNITLLSDMQKQNVLNIINSFASEALRTLCIAFKDLIRHSTSTSKLHSQQKHLCNTGS
jgi:magnesium-transporting ATPase (P-type)